MSEHIENVGEYSVKNVKSFMGMDTKGYNANLYRGTKKVAFCIDDGNGGEVMVNFLGADRNTERALLKSHCDSLPPIDSGYEGLEPLDIDFGLFVEELIYRFHIEKDIAKMRKVCQEKTLFRASNESNPNAYRILKNVCDDRIRDHLRTKYGADVEIFNDVFAQGGVPTVLQNND
jgi:hypothetical protein